MQLLVLKLLYILFTSKGTSEFFYTNDLFVLVDVFLRQLIDLGEDNESVSASRLYNVTLLHTNIVATTNVPPCIAPAADEDAASEHFLQTASASQDSGDDNPGDPVSRCQFNHKTIGRAVPEW